METSEGVTASGVFWRMGDWTVATGVDEAHSAAGSGERSARAGALRRRRSAGRAWARDLVTSRLGAVWAGFAADAPGRKPRLLGDARIDVSIAHSASTLLVAVVAEGLVGADVEEEPFDVFDRVALIRRMCSADEQVRLERLPRTARRRALARAWTIKEATLKARGTGLSKDPRRVPTDALDRAIDDTASGPERAIVHFTVSGGCVVSFPARDDSSPDDELT
ncbi:4'-phosphopantetheinyl transferase superfamily protein [Agromyces sp. ISL-38]|nr:4'-phosphopantetheinyl transferase superfamily protein [Agromyces sp. ISL-38]